jgi:hypothetical protein
LNTERAARPVTRWSASSAAPIPTPTQMAPLLLVTGTYLLWWALSLILGPLWLALRRQTHEILDDIRSLGDGR